MVQLKQPGQKWEDDTVNAYASRWWEDWNVNLPGGLARINGMTKDTFILVACHEMGHHLGGAPKRTQAMAEWSSVEGQADYFATLKCFRKFTENENHEDLVASFKYEIPNDISSNCKTVFPETREFNLCLRSSYASYRLAKVMKSLRFDTSSFEFKIAELARVKDTFEGHPTAQCRLNTLLNGAICNAPTWEVLSGSDLIAGACTVSKGYSYGLRDGCWYAGKESQ